MSINFAAFLKQSSSTFFVASSDVVCFSGTTYPLLFFSQLRMHMQHVYDGPIETINLKEADIATFKSRLQTSFLGNSVVFFLQSIDELDKKKQQNILTYLYSYRGPNKVYFFLPNQAGHKVPARWTVVELAQAVDKKIFALLMTWQGMPLSSRVKECITHLFTKHNTVSLEIACLLFHYIVLVGPQSTSFFNEWLEHIVASEHSLFSLSQYFFQKKADLFWAQWHKMCNVYGSPFWVAFWSEQLWRASMLITLNKKKQFAQARKIAFRLPFSFINNDWKKYAPAELHGAHHFIYELDYHLKNGGDSFGLDLFYSKFFCNDFC